MHVNSTAMWQDKRRFFKFLVCFIGGLILTKLIGYPNVMTISATGLLVINSDRGEMGSRHYMLRRTITNLLCAVLGGVLLNLSLKYVPLPSWIQVIVVGVIIIVVGVAIDARHTIAPMALTIAMGALIVTTGTVSSPYYGLRRVILVVVGCAWGWLVDYVFLPRHPLQIVETKLRSATPRIQAMLAALVGEGALPEPAAVAAVEQELVLAQKDLGLLLGNLTHRKYREKADYIRNLQALYRVEAESLALQNHIVARYEIWLAQPEEFRQQLGEYVAQHLVREQSWGRGLLEQMTPGEGFPVSSGQLYGENNEQIQLCARLLRYGEAVEALQ